MSKIKAFLSNKYFLLGMIIATVVFAVIAIGLCIGALKTVPEEFLPLIRSLVAFMVMGFSSLIITIFLFIILAKKIPDIITTVKIDTTPKV
jgi:hypothetical protein